MAVRLAVFCATLSVLLLSSVAVDKNNFKTCSQSSFCSRNRKQSAGETPYKIDPKSVRNMEEFGCQMEVTSTENDKRLKMDLTALEGNMFRLRIDEKNPLRPRYRVEGSLQREPERRPCQVHRSKDGVEVVSQSGKATITYDPFQVEFSVNGEIAVLLNSRGLFNFEYYRKKSPPPPPPTTPPPPVDEPDPVPREEGEGEGEGEGREEREVGEEEGDYDYDLDEEEPVEPESREEEGMWEETFKTHKDSKPYGPSAVTMDISFPGVEHVYGIPEHADTFLLKTTNDGEPYRLYNLDVFEYELYNKMALYGSIPFMLAHNWSKTVGVFWHNAAETWIDITNAAANKNILGKLLSYFQSDEDVPQTDTQWISESGIIDIFILLGPRPYDVLKQYAALTGTPPQPPLFSIAYHQSRWNYNDEKDVATVDEGFDQHDIPYDVLWLDIEHTDGKRYFTWDSGKFPTPADMQNKLAQKGRKMVTIIDPHIKRDGNYFIHKDAESNGYYVKKADNTSVYDGWCWPGSSSWIDFVNPEIRKWWSEQFALDKYEGSTLNLFTWNDMNEPSVFNGPEITMHKDSRHYRGWEHRDVHNIYGMLQQEATADGQLMRSGERERPFVLSRAFFAGSQRFGAVWTGDNAAEWDHLKISIPMLLSLSIAGLQFVGADVGGFFKNPDPELLVRWYQAGAFYPFMRAHAHLDTRRREPWLYDADKMEAIRQAVRLRYQLLPFWYSMFHEAHRLGLPVIRPLWIEFPRDKNTWATEDQFMVGDCLLVHPVTEQGATSVQLYLPGANTVWYDADDHTMYTGGSRYSISTPLSKIPVFQKGGTIIPKKMRVRRSSALTTSDPYTLVIALDPSKEARGELYIDDGHSNDYLTGGFVVREFEFDRYMFTSRTWDFSGTFPTKAWVERIVVIGYPVEPYKIMISLGAGSEEIMFSYKSSTKTLTIRQPGINILEDFSITIYDG